MSERGDTAAGAGHLVVVTTSYPTHRDDASGHFVQAEARALSRQGRRVTVLAPRVGSRALATLETDSVEPGVEVRWLPAGDAFGAPGALPRLRERPLRLVGVARFVLAARRELRRLGSVERIVAHFVVPSAFPICAFAGRAPLELVAHGSDVGLLEALPKTLRRRIARSLVNSDVRCVSSELRARLGRALGPDFAARARVQPSPLELDAPLERAQARQSLGVADAARVVVVVGRLLPSKRVEQALRAATLVPGAQVVVVGDGPERARLEREFPDVRFTGELGRSGALTWLSAADVLLSASQSEGAPSVVREARALGTRVVATRAGDLVAWGEADPGLSVLAGAL